MFEITVLNINYKTNLRNWNKFEHVNLGGCVM